MKDDRKNLHRHIQAAQNWLSLAEKSIEKEEDLQGDLKLMLAKAELKNAERHRNKKWLKKLLSLTAAIFITCGIFLFKNATNEVDKLPELTFNTSLPSPPSETEKQQMEFTASDSAIEQPKLNSNVDSDSQNYDNDEPAENNFQDLQESPLMTNESVEPIYSLEVMDSQVEEDIMYENNSSNETEGPFSLERSEYIQSEPIERLDENISTVTITPEAKTPPENMQKLMQSAGQILRAE